MPLVSSGQIKFSDINVELGLSATTQISLGQTSVRTLFGVANGAIRLAADGYGKANAVTPVGVTTAGPPIFYDFGATNQSFTGVNATLTASGGAFSTLNATANDPYMTRTGLSISGLKYPYVEVNILRINGTTGWDGSLYYRTGSHNESESFKNLYTQPTWDGVNYQYMIVDNRNLIAGGNDWTNSTITGLRFDFGLTSVDDFRIDWIQLRGTIYPVAGLYQSYQSGYHNENVNYMTAPTAEGATNSVNYPSIGENISYQWVGYFLAPSTGTYNFRLTSDDGSYFWIGNNAISDYTTSNTIVSANFFTGTVTSQNVQLTAGTYYPVRLLYGNGGGVGSISLSFSGPGIANRTDGTGYFFYNADTIGI